MLLEFVPPWLVALLAYGAALALLSRLKVDRRRGSYFALAPVLLWLGTVYLLTHLRLGGFESAELRAAAIRPGIALLLAVHLIVDVVALRRARRGP